MCPFCSWSAPPPELLAPPELATLVEKPPEPLGPAKNPPPPPCAAGAPFEFSPAPPEPKIKTASLALVGETVSAKPGPSSG